MSKIPQTPALRSLNAAAVAFTAHPYRYGAGGTREFAEQLAVDEHLVIKTLIMEDQDGRPCVVLMHGDREVATGRLAKQVGAKRLKPCAPTTAEKHSGYQVGGTSPFGTRHRMPIYCQKTIAECETIYINGGRRGLILSLRSADLLCTLEPVLVDAMQ